MKTHKQHMNIHKIKKETYEHAQKKTHEHAYKFMETHTTHMKTHKNK